MRLLYCRKCAHSYQSVAGDQPAICPGCECAALWTTEPVPCKTWELSENDKRFLRGIKVSPVPFDEDDGA